MKLLPSALIQETTQHLGNKERAEVAEQLLKFVVGVFSKKRLAPLCKTYAVPSESLKKVLEYVKDYKGRALRTAFMDVKTYHTSQEQALAESKASKLDFDYLTTWLPIENQYEFEISIPKTLVKRRTLPESDKSVDTQEQP